MKFYVYVLYSEGWDIYYKGQCNDVEDRLRRHNAGYEASTSKYRPWTLKWYCQKPTRTEAVTLENKLKNLSRERLEAFLKKYG